MSASGGNGRPLVYRSTSEASTGRSDRLSPLGDGDAADSPTVIILTDAQATEMRRLHRTRSIECGALTTNLMCAGCDGAAMNGGGPCQHDCHLSRDLEVLANVGRVYLDAVEADPEFEMLTGPQALMLTEVRDAVRRVEVGRGDRE